MSINHLGRHIAASLVGSDLQPPFLSLIASGGHTSLFRVSAWRAYAERGRTLCDAAGQASDKVARQLGLPYPGGAALSALAQDGDPAAVSLPQPLRNQTGYEFSFSGLKTAVATLLAKQPDVSYADVAAAFEQVVVNALVDVVSRAARDSAVSRVSVAGGVAANRLLRERLLADTELQVHFPPLELSSDNGAMIALAAHELITSGARQPDPSELALDALPYFPLAQEPASVGR